MIVIPIITGLIGVGQAYLNNVVGQNVMQDLRNALYAHLQRMPLRFFTETRTGEIQSRLANDVGGVQSVVTDTAANLTSNVAVAISTIVAMFLIDWRLTVLSLAVTAVLPVPDLPGRQGPADGQHRDPEVARRDVGGDRGDAQRQRHAPVARRSASRPPSIARFRDLNRRLAALQIRQAMVGRWFFMIIGTIFSITPAFVYWLAGDARDQNGDPTAPTIGEIVAFTTLQSRLFFPLGAAAQRPGRDPGLARAVRPDLRVPRAGARDRRRAGCRSPSTRRRSRARSASATSRSATRRRRRPPSSGTDELDAGADEPEDDDGGREPIATTSRRPASRCSRPGRRPTPPGSPSRLGRVGRPARGARGGRRRTAGRPAGRLAPRRSRLEGIDFEAAARASSSRSSARPARARPRRPTSSRACTTSTPARSRSTATTSARSPSSRSAGSIGFVTQETYLFHASIRDNLLYARPDATDAELEVAATRGGDPRPDHRAARRLRHDRRRARLQALGRREAADRDRPGPAQGPPDPHPRRGDLGARHGQRAAHPGGPRAADGGPHDDRHRPPPVDDPARRPDPRLRARAGSSSAAPTPSCSPQGGLYARLYREQFESDRTASCVGRMTTDRGRPTLRHEGGMRFAAVTGTGSRRRSSATAPAERRAQPDRDRARGARRLQRDGRRLDRAQEAPGVRPLRGPGRGRPARRVPAGPDPDRRRSTRSRGRRSASTRSGAASSCRRTKYCPVNAMLSPARPRSTTPTGSSAPGRSPSTRAARSSSPGRTAARRSARLIVSVP